MNYVSSAEAASYLGNPDNAIPAAQFPHDRVLLERPGLYAWWVDDEGRTMIEQALDVSIRQLIYAGQAGATSSRSAKPSTATLLSRIGTNHLKGTAYGSTFRKTISAILLEPLGLRVERPDRLLKEDNDRISLWMQVHLRVATFAFDDRESLGGIEDAVLSILDPPLNLKGLPSSPARLRLTELRRQLSVPQRLEARSELSAEANQPVLTPNVEPAPITTEGVDEK